MKKLFYLGLFILLMSCNNQKMEYPETRKDNTVDNYFGTEVPDPYRWLEDDMSDETAEWVKAQNLVTFNYLDKIPFRSAIRNRMEELYNFPRMSSPMKKGDVYFYSYNDGLQNQNVIYITNSLEEKGEALLDPNTFSEDGTVALTTLSVSENGKYAGYGISRAGSDWNEFFIKDIKTKSKLDDHLEWIKFSGIAWYKDGFFYSRYDKPEEGKSALSNVNSNNKLYYHKVNTPQSEDELIYSDPENPLRSYYAQVTDDENFLVISVMESTSGNALYIKDLNKNKAILKVVDNFDNDYIVVGSDQDKLFILTNREAPMYKLIALDTKNPDIGNWKDVIPENHDQVLKSCSFAGGKIIALYEKDARSLVNFYEKSGEYLQELELPGIGTVEDISAKDKYDTFYYSFTSFNVPAEVHSFDLKTMTSSLLYKPEVDFNSEDYITEQVFYESKDGTKVPMFIVHKKGLKLDTKRPTLLYGYGGFNITYTPEFKVTNLIWLENGGIYALANIRGGGEYGEEWHQAGTILNKQNVFDDFIAAAEYLIDNKYTSSKRLTIFGGSNGGLLVGAVTNQRPDLFAVSLPAVGVMDMLRFHKFTIGRYWVTDYGSSDNEEQFHYLFKYSPIHNIRDNVEYPAVLVTTADHDDRVVPAHSFKYIATLQEKYMGKNPVLIRIDTKAGHGAGKPVSKVLDEYADRWAFAFYNMHFTPEFE